ncbi:MAG: MerR family transcriptional regulator [Chloroflexia bacterium]|nr:MerR family transcriptional regulator [Chloroflexia bacterium]
MARQHQDTFYRIGELAEQSGTSTDAVRYYERLGLMAAPSRAGNGYRRYGEADLGRLRFIRRAKRLGLSLEEIRGLLGIAQTGECQPLRRQVAELLAQKINECEAQLAEIAAFKSQLEARHRLALDRLDEPACGCAGFPASCGCLPVPLADLDVRQNGASDDA